ncbi:MAG: hypothetical protein ABIX01_03595 [Chitinophagaceae bacterium]
MTIFNQDFREIIASLNDFDVHYVLIGGYSRSTGDMDIWVEKTSENYKKLMTAFYHFGLPTNAISPEGFWVLKMMSSVLEGSHLPLTFLHR